MTLVYSVFLKKINGELKTLLKDGKRDEAFSIIIQITGYKKSALINKLNDLSGIQNEKIWNRRNILIEERYF